MTPWLLLPLAGLPAVQIKPLALLLNTVVAAQGSWQFWRAGHLRWRLFWPLLLAGAVGSRLGSRHWPVAWIRRTLALVLLLAAWKLAGLA